MTKKTSIGALAVALVVISLVVGASAFTSGTVSRSANVDVVNDDVGLIALQAGDSSFVTQNDSGALNIDFATGEANGVNTAAHFELGDRNSANTSYAFNISNLDSESHNITVSYTTPTTDNDTGANIQFEVYDGTGTLLGTADETGTAASLTGITSGQTVYVVMIVDTHGLTSTDDLSGTLEVSV